MKKTLTINLAGMVFHIDEDAFEQLQSFLEALNLRLKDEANSAEIIRDIEARMAELLSGRMNQAKQVISANDVENLIQTIGHPDLIFGDDQTKSNKKNSFGERKYRRMYRDPENRMLGGVCAGLAAYWHLDPTLVRVAFVLLTALGGTGLILYIILLVVLPEAHTTAQKLEMRGEPVTIENIKNFFADEFENVKRSFKQK